MGTFLHWVGWTPGQVFEIKREAMKQEEPRSKVETRIRKYHEVFSQDGLRRQDRSQVRGRDLLLHSIERVAGSEETRAPRHG